MPKILVVDDNKDAAISLGTILHINGHEVKTAFDGIAALALVDEYKPRYIIQDIGMPGMDGFEIVRNIRGKYNKQMITIIALTGGANCKKKALSTGFCHYLSKPVDFEALFKLLF